jgi:nucleoside phosphorylase
MRRTTALVVALATERRALLPCLASTRLDWVDGLPAVHGEVAGQPVLLVQAGIGFFRARAAVEAIASRHALTAVWSVGLAGGLIDPLGAGDLVCPLAILPDAAGAEAIPTGPAAQKILAALTAAGLSVHPGPLFTSRVALRTPEEKQAAHRRTSAAAVDMEAAGVALAARELHVPAVALKAIADPVGESLPEIVAACMTPAGGLSWQGILRAFAAVEGRRSLARLRQAARCAEAALRQALPFALKAWPALTSSGRSSTM